MLTFEEWYESRFGEAPFQPGTSDETFHHQTGMRTAFDAGVELAIAALVSTPPPLPPKSEYLWEDRMGGQFTQEEINRPDWV